MIPKDRPIIIICGEDRNEVVAYTLARDIHNRLDQAGYQCLLRTWQLMDAPYSIIKGGHVRYGAELSARTKALYNSLLEEFHDGEVFTFHNGKTDYLFGESLWGEHILEIPAIWKPITNRSVLEAARSVYLPGEDLDDLLRHIRHQTSHHKDRMEDDDYSFFYNYFSEVTDVPATWARFGKERMIREILDYMAGCFVDE